MNKIFNKKYIVNALFIGFFLVIIFVPSAKALMIQGLMQIGLFSPGIREPAAKSNQETRSDFSGIQFKDASGKIVDLGELKGKVVFLNFWATWCPPCMAEMPSVNRLYEQFKDDKDVVFILVDADSDLIKAQKYMDNKNYNLPVFQVASDIPETIFKGSLPTTIVFDKKGRVSYHEVGAANYANEKFIEFLKKLKASNI